MAGTLNDWLACTHRNDGPGLILCPPASILWISPRCGRRRAGGLSVSQAATHVCPCDYLWYGTERWRCSDAHQYRSRISRSLLDRLDPHIEIPQIALRQLAVLSAPSCGALRHEVEGPGRLTAAQDRWLISTRSRVRLLGVARRSPISPVASCHHHSCFIFWRTAIQPDHRSIHERIGHRVKLLQCLLPAQRPNDSPRAVAKKVLHICPCSEGARPNGE